jgi:hypothetical protein
MTFGQNVPIVLDQNGNPVALVGEARTPLALGTSGNYATISASTYTITTTDAGKSYQLTNTSGVAITGPAAGVTLTAAVVFDCPATGTVSFVPASGTVLYLPGGSTTTAAQTFTRSQFPLGFVLVPHPEGNAYSVTASATGLSNATETFSSTGTNATTPIESLAATGAATNIGFAIAAKGTGPILAQVPDGTTAGGNARGANAVDFQVSRNTATMVASGGTSMILNGRNNTSSGTDAVAGGFQSTASGNESFAFGIACTASGKSSTALGQGSATADHSLSHGLNTLADVIGKKAFSPASATQQQYALVTVFSNSSVSTAVTLTADGLAASTNNQNVLRNNNAYYVTGSVVAYDATGNVDCKQWTFTALIKRGANAAATSLVSAVTPSSTIATAGASGWTLAVVADTTNGALQIQLTSGTTNNIKCVCTMQNIEAY